MNLHISILPRSDTFAHINGHRLRLGRDWSERVTAGELSDRFARAFHEMGATPLVMSSRTESVFGVAERADGMVDAYMVSVANGMVRATYTCSVSPEGERVYR